MQAFGYFLPNKMKFYLLYGAMRRLKMPAVVYVRQDATVLSKGSPCMGEEVEVTAFF